MVQGHTHLSVIAESFTNSKQAVSPAYAVSKKLSLITYSCGILDSPPIIAGCGLGLSCNNITIERIDKIDMINKWTTTIIFSYFVALPDVKYFIVFIMEQKYSK